MFKSEKGVSAVEFALIAPLLFVLTFGIIEFGILLFDKAVVTNASREGARAAIVYHTNPDASYSAIPETEITAVVQKYTDKYLISLGSITAVPPPDITYVDRDGVASEVGVSGGDVIVTVTYPYSFLVFTNLLKLLDGDLTGTINVVGRTVMRME